MSDGRRGSCTGSSRSRSPSLRPRRPIRRENYLSPSRKGGYFTKQRADQIIKMAARQQLRVAVTVAVAAALWKVAFPQLRRRVETAFYERCRRMAHDMEFGERLSCQMCYDMHSAMHRRTEREMVLTQG